MAYLAYESDNDKEERPARTPPFEVMCLILSLACASEPAHIICGVHVSIVLPSSRRPQLVEIIAIMLNAILKISPRYLLSPTDNGLIEARIIVCGSSSLCARVLREWQFYAGRLAGGRLAAGSARESWLSGVCGRRVLYWVRRLKCHPRRETALWHLA